MTNDPDPTPALRSRLLELRGSALAQAAELEHELSRAAEAAVGANTDDEHDPEGATTAFERQQVAAVLAAARQRVEEVDAALDRLAAGGHGRCESCDEPIAAGRLLARPTASQCVGCAAAS